jgi:hypothetical protein
LRTLHYYLFRVFITSSATQERNWLSLLSHSTFPPNVCTMSWSSSSPSGGSTTNSAIPSPLETPASSTHPPSSQQSPKSQSEAEERHPLGPSSNSSVSDQSKERVTVPSACVACRSKHLKCDGLSPCTRCSTNSKKSRFLNKTRALSAISFYILKAIL